MPFVISYYCYKKISRGSIRIKVKRYILLFIASLSFIAMVKGQDMQKEPLLKAAFIYNFTKYIDWGAKNIDDFTICIIGNSPVYLPLTQIASTKTVRDKKIVVRMINKPEEITGCDVLFIPVNNSFPLSLIFTNTGKGTLTISETPGYANLGTAINFVIVNDKLKFEANVKSINDEGLKASAQLLKLAIIID